MSWVRTIRGLAANVQNELKQELKLQELQESIKKAESLNLKALSPELGKTVEELENAVKKDMSVAFTLYPVGIDEVMNISDLELSMPPKSTWVEPKLATGFLMYKIQ